MSARRMSIVALLGTCGLLCAAPSIASTQERTLENGMKIVVREDRRAPVVASMIWYRVGSVDEVNGLTGLAHVTEHMMFRGTRRLPDGEFSRRVAQLGGRDNAFTGRDYTAYHQQLSAKDLAAVIELEAERMAGLVIAPDTFAKEMQVVMEERRWRTDDRPRAALFEQLYATAFTAHPYRTPVIGWMNDLENLTADDARDFYRRWYAPNNAVLVVVGDVDAEQVFRLAQRHFGRLPARAMPRRSPQSEPEQKGIRRVTLQAPAQTPFLMLGFHVPALRDGERDWEPYALEVLESILDASEAARLPRALLRESRIAGSVDASYDKMQRGPALFVITAAPSEGRGVGELESAIRAELARVTREGVSAEELVRAQTQLVAQHMFQRDSMFTQATQIGVAEMVGHSARVVDRFVPRIRAITAEQVRDVARRFLVEERMTVAVLEPLNVPTRRPSLPPKELRHVD
ncbi:MAG: insulinase family protein [Proteobacteria bacterium]|nr:insulinase family protein [Burkholderiales bacterium]